MKQGEDPRPDQHKDRPGGGYPDTGTSTPKTPSEATGGEQSPKDNTHPVGDTDKK